MFYVFPKLSVIDVTGAESDKILHNLTTNHVRALAPAQGCETFVTDVRGKTLGHVIAFRSASGYRLLGAAGQSERIVEHVNRYTIREDAVPAVLDEQWTGLLVQSSSLEKLELVLPLAEGPLSQGEIEWAGHSILWYAVPWLGTRDALWLFPGDSITAVVEALNAAGLLAGDEQAFQERRTLVGFPWFGIDLDETNLPQEADRDAQTICFTKGCYLGQETIARLDALGQVQKKLIRWSIPTGAATAGMTLTAADKVVARLTSVAVDNHGAQQAIAMTRRSHFAPGSLAEGLDPQSGQSFQAVVL